MRLADEHEGEQHGWAMNAYFQIIQDTLAEIQRTQREPMEQSAQLAAEDLLGNHYIYAFGSGHSHTLSEEVFYRAGGLARVVPVLDENLMVHKSATASTEWERKEGYAAEVLGRYAMTVGDVFFIVSNSGRNAVPIEMALEAKKRGAKVVAISGVKCNVGISSRHSSGKKLAEVADVVIDNCGVAGDAAVSLPGLAQKIGPTSIIASAFILNSVLIAAAQKVLAAGGTPEVWGSANSDASGNEALLAKYKGVIPHL